MIFSKFKSFQQYGGEIALESHNLPWAIRTAGILILILLNVSMSFSSQKQDQLVHGPKKKQMHQRKKKKINNKRVSQQTSAKSSLIWRTKKLSENEFGGRHPPDSN